MATIILSPLAAPRGNMDSGMCRMILTKTPVTFLGLVAFSEDIFLVAIDRGFRNTSAD